MEEIDLGPEDKGRILKVLESQMERERDKDVAE